MNLRKRLSRITCWLIGHADLIAWRYVARHPSNRNHQRCSRCGIRINPKEAKA